MITGTTRGVGVAMGSPTETCIVSTGWMDRKDDEADEDAERPGCVEPLALPLSEYSAPSSVTACR